MQALNQQQQVIKQITASPTTSTTKAVADAAGDQGSSRDDATSKGRAAPPTGVCAAATACSILSIGAVCAEGRGQPRA
jgi:hypothetical protein